MPTYVSLINWTDQGVRNVKRDAVHHPQVQSNINDRCPATGSNTLDVQANSITDNVVVEFSQGPHDDEIRRGDPVGLLIAAHDSVLLDQFHLGQRDSHISSLDKTDLPGLVEGTVEHVGDALSQGAAETFLLVLPGLVVHFRQRQLGFVFDRPSVGHGRDRCQ